MTIPFLSFNHSLKYVIILIILLSSGTVTDSLGQSGGCETAVTTKDMAFCLESKLRTTGEELSNLQTRIEKFLTPKQRDILSRAQTIWLQYRDANCASVEAYYHGGSMETIALIGCKVRMTEHRIQELKLIYEEILRLPNP